MGCPGTGRAPLPALACPPCPALLCPALPGMPCPLPALYPALGPSSLWPTLPRVPNHHCGHAPCVAQPQRPPRDSLECLTQNTTARLRPERPQKPRRAQKEPRKSPEEQAKEKPEQEMRKSKSFSLSNNPTVKRPGLG